MKSILFFLSFTILSVQVLAQSSEHKNNVSIGAGRQSYNGDLGNAWFEFHEEWYGFVTAEYSRYINPSFDIRASLTHGDYGHCRMEDDLVFWADDGTERLNMLSRMTSGVVSLKYKFANGYLLNENARISPYILIGAGINNLANIWNHPRVETGNYFSGNIGGGIRYQVSEMFNVTYNITFGQFSKDNLDRRVEGTNDRYMQSGLSCGINF